ncbi:hypothetical protein HZA75_01615 [Candidatus Roizmanbacteria bacterium]|nr:hypothetical protein [Candidatus Roizmanbacteria bacterium]
MEKNIPETPTMHSFKEAESVTEPLVMKNVVIVFVIVAILGVGTGFILSNIYKSTGKQLISLSNPGIAKGKTFGSNDMKVFKDSTEGRLEVGGVNGEGQYHLVRPGGDSQNVYLTSSLVDLSQFVGKKIKVWGETQKAQTAGWLMDVGKVEVL